MVGMMHKGSSDLHHNYDHTHRINVTTPYFASQMSEGEDAERGEGISGRTTLAEGRKRSGGLPRGSRVSEKHGIVESSIEDEAIDISANFFSAGVLLLLFLLVRLLVTSEVFLSCQL
jgi:hypothetical protein